VVTDSRCLRLRHRRCTHLARPALDGVVAALAVRRVDDVSATSADQEIATVAAEDDVAARPPVAKSSPSPA
jgi:hypothetical protein